MGSHRIVGALSLALLLTACAGIGSQGAQSAASVGGVAGPGSGVVTAQGAGWSGTQLFGTVPPAGSCHEGHEVNQVLPDRHCTPGAIDPRVSQSTLQTTICRQGGYTSTVRPPEAVTERAKRQLMQSYGFNGPLGEYELDHLIPLEVGGASDLHNLWPEQNIGKPSEYDPRAEGANAKDGVEGRLHEAVCSGQVPLAAAQEAIATDWTMALTRLKLAH